MRLVVDFVIDEEGYLEYIVNKLMKVTINSEKGT